MRLLLPAALCVSLLAGMPAGFAQDNTSASPGSGTATGSSNNAVNTNGNAGSDVNASGMINVVAPSALEKGANSFTEGQAKSRIASAGFTDVGGLTKDDQGIWRGTAKHGGKNVSVGFDYKGNIGAE